MSRCHASLGMLVQVGVHMSHDEVPTAVRSCSWDAVDGYCWDQGICFCEGSKG